MIPEKHIGFTVKKKMSTHEKKKCLYKFEEKHVLAMRRSINLAKNIKQRNTGFALMKREVI